MFCLFIEGATILGHPLHFWPKKLQNLNNNIEIQANNVVGKTSRGSPLWIKFSLHLTFFCEIGSFSSMLQNQLCTLFHGTCSYRRKRNLGQGYVSSDICLSAVQCVCGIWGWLLHPGGLYQGEFASREGCLHQEGGGCLWDTAGYGHNTSVVQKVL